MGLKASKVFGCIEALAPKRLAESWDNVGLQIGSYSQMVERILLTLDVTPAVVQEAVDCGADLIISHHPFIFNGLKHICFDEHSGALVEKLIKNEIGVYTAHTNIDIAEFGLNDYIANTLGIENRRPLDPATQEMYYKLVVYVPVEKTADILEVLGENGAGFIGNYSHCTFRATGKGTFKPLENTHPYIGEEGQVETVVEDRIETIIDGRMVKTMIGKLKKAHPYEEMAYDLYPLDGNTMVEKDGLGKIGELEVPMTPDAFLNHVKTALSLGSLRTAGTPPDTIRRVALCTGSGSEFIGLAKLKKADVYITGDLKYHDAQRAAENNLWVIDAGHFGTEKLVVGLLKHTIEAAFPEGQVQCIKSRQNQDFFKYY